MDTLFKEWSALGVTADRAPPGMYRVVEMDVAGDQRDRGDFDDPRDAFVCASRTTKMVARLIFDSKGAIRTSVSHPNFEAARLEHLTAQAAP